MIEREHNALCAQIEHKISEVLLRRGDYNLVGELGNLKDQLGAARKEAKQMARNQIQSNQSQISRRVIHDEGLNDHHSTEISMEGCSTEDVFVDDFIVVDECPDPGRRKESNLSRIIQRDRTRNTEPVWTITFKSSQSRRTVSSSRNVQSESQTRPIR